MPMTLPPPYAVENRQLIILVIIAFCANLIFSLILTVVAARAIILSNRRLAARYEELRTQTLDNFVSTQKAENARVIADTRAINKKMDAVLEDMWSRVKGE